MELGGDPDPGAAVVDEVVRQDPATVAQVAPLGGSGPPCEPGVRASPAVSGRCRSLEPRRDGIRRNRWGKTPAPFTPDLSRAADGPPSSWGLRLAR